MQTEISHSLRHLVYREIDASLRDARYALEAYLDDNSEGTELFDCINLISEVNGAIEVLDHKSLILLTNTLVRLLDELKLGKIEDPEAALILLLKGMLEIPNYLFLLEHDAVEYDRFYVPLVNQIRRVLGENAYLDDEPELSIENAESSLVPLNHEVLPDKLRAYFKTKRPEYLQALLAFYKSADFDGIERKTLWNIIEDLSITTQDTAVGEYFNLAGLVLEHEIITGQESLRAVKLLFGKLDSLIKSIINTDELVDNPEFIRLGNKLIARAVLLKPDTAELEAIRSKYPAEKLLNPAITDIRNYRDFVEGPNTESFESIAHIIRVDLMQIKEAFERYLSEQNIHSLDGSVQSVINIVNVLELLGFVEKSQSLSVLAEELSESLGQNNSIENGFLERFSVEIVDLERNVEYLAQIRSSKTDDFSEDVSALEMKSAQAEYGRQIKDAVNKLSVHLIELKKNHNKAELKENVINELIELNGAIGFYFDSRLNSIFQSFIEFLDHLDEENDGNESFQEFADLLIDIEAICISFIENATATNELLSELEDKILPHLKKTDTSEFSGVVAEKSALESFVGELALHIEEPTNAESAIKGLDHSCGVDDPFTDEEFTYLISILDDSSAERIAPVSSKLFISEAIEPLNMINYLQPKWMDNISDNELLNEVRKSYIALKVLSENQNQPEISRLCGHVVTMLSAIEQQTLNFSLAMGDILSESEKELIKIIGLADSGINPEDLSSIVELSDSIGALLEHLSPSNKQDDEKSEVIEPKVQLALDSDLFEIYEKETLAHLDTLLLFIQNNHNDLINDDVIRALHTMHGSSHMANVHDMAEVTGALEEKFVELQGEGFRLDDTAAEVLADFVNTTKSLLPMLLEDGASYTEKKTFIERVQALSKNIQPADQYRDITVYVSSEDELVEIFLEEAQEILAGLDVVLTKWQEKIDDKDVIHELERALHTLKGGARMASLQIIADISHEVESKLRSYLDEGHGDLEYLYHIVSQTIDQLVNIVESVVSNKAVVVLGDFLAKLGLYETYAAASADIEPAPVSTSVEQEAVQSLAGIDLDMDLSLDMDLDLGTFVEEEEGDIASMASDLDMDLEIELDDDTPLPLSAETEEPVIEAMKQTSDVDAVIPETVKDTAVQTGDTSVSESAQLEQIRVRADILDSLVKQASEGNTVNSSFEKHISEFKFNMDEMNSTVERLKSQLRQLEIETESQIVYRMDGSTGSISNDFDPLEFDRFTQLQTLSRSMIESLSDLENIESSIKKELRSSEKTLNIHSRISQDLQDGLLRTRMTPFKTVIARLTRVVNQTSRELKKPIDFHVHGEDLEIDGTLLARVVSPIEHILRNAVYHGIERKEIRAARKKPEHGNVTLSIEYEGSNLVVMISDDGGGLDTDAIRSKAEMLGVLPQGTIISDEDAAQLILESGLSTATELSQISGRGVGMDVVNTEVRTVGGTLHIATKKNSGTTFTIHLPSKMSLLQAMLVSSGNSHYAIPVVGIDGIQSIDGVKLSALIHENDAKVERFDDTYHILALSQLLEKDTDSYVNTSNKYTLIYTRFAEHRYALYVDSYYGNKEVVTKQFGPQFDDVRGVQGATILSDGSLALILDLSTLVRPGIKTVLSKYTSEPRPVNTRATVLVVDDSITVRRVSEKYLQKNNFAVLTSKDGIDAISMLEEHTPDIVLLDIEMPRMNGYDFLQHIRRDERLKDLPVIMITSRTGGKHKDKAFELGANDFFGKPYDEKILIARINELIK